MYDVLFVQEALSIFLECLYYENWTRLLDEQYVYTLYNLEALQNQCIRHDDMLHMIYYVDS